MDYSGTFARHFSRLVYLLIHEGENRDEQKMALRAITAISREGAVTIASRGDDLVANGEVVPSPLTGVRDVIERLAVHGLAEVRFDATSAPAHLLDVARRLAADPTIGVTPAPAVEAPPAAAEPVTRAGPEPAAARPSGRITPTVSGLVPEGGGGLFMQFAAAPIKESPDSLGARLAAASDSGEVMRLLDDLVTLAENSAREGKAVVVGEIFHGIVQR